MSKSIKTDTYATLVKDFAELYSRARKALVESYWQIGKRIVEQEQQGQTNAVYGKQLIARLSEDLSHKLGGGFSVRNLYRMRDFYLGAGLGSDLQLKVNIHVPRTWLCLEPPERGHAKPIP